MLGVERTELKHARTAPARRRPAAGDGGAAPPAHEPARLRDVVGSLSMAQLARLTTGALWVGWGAIVGEESTAAAAALLGTLVAAAGLAIVAAAVIVRAPSARRRLDWLLISGTIAIVVIVPLVGHGGWGYITDELAYDQAAASSLLHGANPYPQDFTWALHAYGVAAGSTMQLQGTPVPYIAYPSLSFLLYVPAVAVFGARSAAGSLVDLLAWGVAGWLLWRTLGEPLRQWVPVLVLLPVFVGLVAGDLTDPLFIPFEIVALTGWDRFTDRSLPRRWRWLGPVALGLACAIKQQPWLLVPFLVIGISIEARRQRLPWQRFAAEYLAIVGVAFLIPNLPFIVWDPHAWLQRVTLPVSGGLVPMGLGPAGLMRPFAIGGGNLSLFSVATVFALAGAIALYVRQYSTLRRILPLLPVAALFVSARSFESYLVFCIPALVINAATLRPWPAHAPATNGKRLMRLAGPLCLSVAAVAATAALFVPAPLRLTVTSAAVNGSQLRVAATVHNAAGRVIDPNFFLASGLYYNQELTVVSGPARLTPGATASYVFTTGELPVSPQPGELFQLQAGTRNPDTIATSEPATVAPLATSQTSGG